MARGRKKVDGSLREVISTRISQEQKEVLNKNVWIKKDIDKMIRDYLQSFVFKN
ncbi:hypothetical protein [Haloimpatiens lingqiaonensis]|uniref:hypothetical protein n=1 Tax=Haloimpatiens lingqiaonensis TaxID=1380675 RepID=UPI0014853635|nr:hypothetical protein [Haloimpatiens lingqiaonensis]